MSDRDLVIRLGTVEQREAFASCSTISAKWSDGTGDRDELLTVLPAE